MTKGYYNSIQTIGTLDGPGLRYVLFTQGCPFRCLFCHNPESWNGKGKNITVDELVTDILKYKVFYETSNGGFTVSGGEPLLQIPFLIEVFKKLKENNIHTTIDTCGHIEITNELKKLAKLTDLFMLDIKHLDNEKHIQLTGKPNNKVLNFLNFLSKENKKIWIRQVIVPGWTQDDKYLNNLINFLKNYDIERIELLPYHNMGESKYKALGLEYKLTNTPTPSKDEILKIRQMFNDKGFYAV